MLVDRRTLMLGAAGGAALVAAPGAAAKPGAKRPYKVIPTEESFTISEVVHAQARYMRTHSDEAGVSWSSALGRFPALTEDWGTRVATMDRDGVDTQVLGISAPGVQIFGADEGTALARLSNDRVTEEAVRKYPGRFALMAAIAPQNPAAAAKELERAVTRLGAKAGIINGHTKGEYLDENKFMAIFEAAESLDVPIYIHPREPSPQMLGPFLKWGLETGAWGFAAEVSMHVLRMIWAGVFDRYPKLKIVIGHAGENMPFVLGRIDQSYRSTSGNATHPGALKPVAKRPPSEYFKTNIYCTTSGVNWAPTINFMQTVLGPERVLFAIDYPFADPLTIKRAEETSMSAAVRKQFFQTNAEKLFKLA